MMHSRKAGKIQEDDLIHSRLPTRSLGMLESRAHRPIPTGDLYRVMDCILWAEPVIPSFSDDGISLACRRNRSNAPWSLFTQTPRSALARRQALGMRQVSMGGSGEQAERGVGESGE